MPPPDPLTLAFPDRPDLRTRAHAAIAHTPSLTDLFTSIATYISHLRASSSPPDPNAADDDSRTAKKRKLEHENSNGLAVARTKAGADDIGAEWEKGSYRALRDVSFSVPVRKRLGLEVGAGGVRARNAGTGGVEFGVLWGGIEYVLCVPLPEKAQAQFSFVVFPTGGEEPIVWTVPDGAPKVGVVEGGGGKEGTEGTGETYRDLLVRWIEEGWGRGVVRAGEERGVGGKGQGWVKGFRGSKDGYLFFLPTGLLWGFKKPLFFFPFALIASVSYTSVLQRTFNLSLTITSPPSSTSPPAEAPTRDFEFSMLDQLDFASIDAYIRTHGLHDASMAEQRRAKLLNINGVKASTASTDEGGADGDGVGELERAEREVRDLEEGGEEEEEEDENFDPGSEGESEGSGSSEEGEEEEGGDLVGEELGSEAEEVDVEGEE